jgi:hypothetical protein
MPTPKDTPVASLDPVSSGASAVADERRSSQRIDREIGLTLTSVGSTEARLCSSSNISEGGLSVQVPPEYGLSVGQRCEVMFASEGESKAPQNLAGEMRYATVVRTEVVTGSARQMIGAGLRFDRPLFL